MHISKTFNHSDLWLHDQGIILITEKIKRFKVSGIKGKDLIDSVTGKYARVRTVAYSLSDRFEPYHKNKLTNRLFIETENVDVTKEAGGPWQAYNNGNSFFMYLFNINKKLITINLNKQTLDIIENIIINIPLYGQVNKGYLSIGKKVLFKSLEENLGRENINMVDLS